MVMMDFEAGDDEFFDVSDWVGEWFIRHIV